jgi:hypothetical protein
MSNTDIWSRLRLNAEIYGIRLRGWIRTIIRVLAIGLIFVGAYLFFEPLLVDGTIKTHEMYLEESAPSLVMMAVGMFVAYKI